MATSKKKGRKVKIDFTGVETGGRIRVPEGDYHVKVVKAEYGTSKTDNPKIDISYEIVGHGKHDGKTLPDTFSLQHKALWKLRKMLEAMEKKVPSKLVSLDLDGLMGGELGVTVADDEYNNHVSSKVMDYLTVDNLKGKDDADEEDEDEESDDEEEDEEESDDDELEEVDLDEM